MKTKNQIIKEINKLKKELITLIDMFNDTLIMRGKLKLMSDITIIKAEINKLEWVLK